MSRATRVMTGLAASSTGADHGPRTGAATHRQTAAAVSSPDVAHAELQPARPRRCGAGARVAAWSAPRHRDAPVPSRLVRRHRYCGAVIPALSRATRAEIPQGPGGARSLGAAAAPHHPAARGDGSASIDLAPGGRPANQARCRRAPHREPSARACGGPVEPCG